MRDELRALIDGIAEYVVEFLGALCWLVISAVLIVTSPVWILPWILTRGNDERIDDDYFDEDDIDEEDIGE